MGAKVSSRLLQAGIKYFTSNMSSVVGVLLVDMVEAFKSSRFLIKEKIKYSVSILLEIVAMSIKEKVILRSEVYTVTLLQQGSISYQLIMVLDILF